MKILVVYFSRSGNTRRVAEEVAWLCGATVERLREKSPRQGASGYLRSLWQAVTRRRPEFLPTTHDPKAFDLVVIGTPVWGKAPAAPVRSYVARHAAEFQRVAFFCTQSTSGAGRTFAELTRLCGQDPVATITFDARHSGVPAAGQSLRRFLGRLTAASTRLRPAAAPLPSGTAVSMRLDGSGALL